MIPVKFTPLEAAMYEAIHQALGDNGGQITKAIDSLLKLEDRSLRKMPWSYAFLEKTMETDSYLAWRATMRNILMAHAEHSAVSLAANPNGLTDQARASVAINILRGSTDKAMQKALRGKRKDPANDPANYSETASLMESEE